MGKIKVIKGSELPIVEDINKSTFLAYEDKTINLKSGRIDLSKLTSLFGVAQEKGQSITLAPSQKIWTDNIYKTDKEIERIANVLSGITSFVDIPFIKKGALASNGEVWNLDTYSTTDYYPVKEGQVIKYQGTSGTTTFAMFGYSNKNGSNPVKLLGVNQTFVDEIVVIPNGVNYIRASGRNETFEPTPIELKCQLYLSLGDINDDLQTLKKDLYQYLPVKLKWVQGYYSTQDGNLVTNYPNPNPQLYVSCERYNFVVGKKLSILINSNYQYRVFNYDSNGVWDGYSDWLSAENKEYVITHPVHGISIKSNDGSLILIEDIEKVGISIKYPIDELVELEDSVNQTTDNLIELETEVDELNNDYTAHKNGIDEQKIILSPTWVSGLWNSSGGTGSSASWIRTEANIVSYDTVELIFACPIHYSAKTYFIDVNNNKVGEYLGSISGAIQFPVPQNAVKLRISNRITSDTEVEGVPNPTVAGVKSGVSKFATEQFVNKRIPRQTNKMCHFSIDDVRNVWSDLVSNENSYTSIFDNSLLGWLKSMRDKYGIVCTLIIDYIERLGTYPVPEKFRQEFVDNMDWLKLGFQAKNNTDYRLQTYETALAHYNEFAENVMSLFSTWEIIDRVVRNNFFHSNINVANGLRDAKCGALGFLGCDDWSYNAATRIVNVYLTDEQSKVLDKRDRWYDYINDFWLFKTDFRFEQVNQRWGNINNCITDYESLNRANEAYDLVVFSHENYYPNLYGMSETFFAWAKNKGYRFDFPMNIILK